MSAPSLLLRREIIDALRNGAVPRRGLEHFATGLERFEKATSEELRAAATGRGIFKALQGDYGSGKTFFSRWLMHRARTEGFATSLVQISETETPLYRMETVYRRAVEQLETSEWSTGAFRALIDRWFYQLEDEVLQSGRVDAHDPRAVADAVGALLEQRLASVSAVQPHFAAALRSAHTARLEGDHAAAEGLIAWLMGAPNVGAGIKRVAGIQGQLDHQGAAGAFLGLLEVLKQTGRKGLLLVLDEVETIQRVRADSREKSLNALRQLIDDLAGSRFPGLYVLITGTTAFFEGAQGVKLLPPLAQRLHATFGPDPRFDSTRATRIRLTAFDRERLVEVGRKVRALYPAEEPERLLQVADDALLEDLVTSVIGQLGGRVGVAPRLFLRKWVDILDRIDEHPDFDPRVHGDFGLAPHEMNDTELAAAGLDAIALDLGGEGELR